MVATAETPISTDPRYRARPTLRINGQNVPQVSDRINSFRITERVGGLSALELRLTNEIGTENTGTDDEFPFESEQYIALGTPLTIYSGEESHPREIFRGMITGIEADFPEGTSSELLVLAEDTLQAGRLARRSKVHDDLKLKDLTTDVAQQLSLTPKVTGFDTSIGTQVQLNESDLAFLRRMLARYDGDLQVVGSELQVTPRKDVDRGVVTLARNSKLRRVRFLADLAHQVTEVTAAGYDLVQGQAVTKTSTGANPGPGTGRTGSQILKDKLGDRSEHIGYPPMNNQDMANAVADAAFDLRARRFVTAFGVTEGDPTVRLGTQVAITGTSKRFDNTYYVTHVCHRFDLDHGYETEFEAECAFLGNP
ncbi:MAG TPA: contractile injection system protein, VgrG/Pvc8 family [Kofleriaceae bacterium]|jgi:phage protein D